MLERLVLSHWKPNHSDQSRLGRILNKLDALPIVFLTKVAMDATIDDVEDASLHWDGIAHDCIIKEPKYNYKQVQSTVHEGDETAYECYDNSLIGVVGSGVYYRIR